MCQTAATSQEKQERDVKTTFHFPHKKKEREKEKTKRIFLAWNYVKFNQWKKRARYPGQAAHQAEFCRHVSLLSRIQSFFCLQYFSPIETMGILFVGKNMKDSKTPRVDVQNNSNIIRGTQYDSRYPVRIEVFCMIQGTPHE